jgi:hypothetical protein
MTQQRRYVASPATGGRPLGVTILSALYVISGIAALATIPFEFALPEYLNALASVGLSSSFTLPFLLVLQIIPAVVAFTLAYGLLKGLNWARVTARILAILAIVGTLASVALLLVFQSPLTPASELTQLIGGSVYLIGISVGTIIGLVIPVAVFWYMGRPNVKAYFAAGVQRGGQAIGRLRTKQKCQACGYNNRDDATFCSNCGASLLTTQMG